MNDFNDFVNAEGEAILKEGVDAVVQKKQTRPKKSKTKYGIIPITFWTEPKYKEVQSCSALAKLTYLYLISCPRRNNIGFFRQPIASMAIDLDVEVEKIEVALEELGKRGLVQFDAATHYLWVVDLFQNDVMILRNGELKPNDDMFIGAVDIFQSLPDISLKELFREKYATLLKFENFE
jgi:hypothetical protein